MCTDPGDCDPCELYSASTPIARKPAACTCCGRTIEPGEQYTRVSGKQDGQWFIERHCAHCELFAKTIERACRVLHDEAGIVFRDTYVIEDELSEFDDWPVELLAARDAMRAKWDGTPFDDLHGQLIGLCR